MARTRKALVTSLLTYIQFGAGIVVALVSVPIVLHYLGPRLYGIWLASGETLAYVALLDFGILGVLPWMVADADGRGDRNEIRRLMAHGFTAGAIAGLAAVIIGAFGWILFAGRLSAADRAALGGPFALLVALTAVTSPLWVFAAVLGGLQDATFNGLVGVARVVLNGVLTIGLLFSGAGVYALAVAAIVPPVVILIAAAWRLSVIAPDLLRGWPRPSPRGLQHLLRQSVGGWIGAFGWRLMTASHNVVIAFLGMPELVPVFACTTRLGQLLTQLGWILPDSGAVGLAQLQGEGRRERVREIVDSMLRLYVLLGGLATATVLAFNPAFVTWWVGPGLFGGFSLNALFAIGTLVGALTHGLSVVVSVLGDRLRIGLAVLAQGVLQVVAAVALGRVLGLNGVAIASLLAASVTIVPVGFSLFHSATGVQPRLLFSELLPAVGLRSWPVFAVSAIAGLWTADHLWGAAAATLAITTFYMRLLRPVYASLRLDGRVRSVLVRLRLVPVGA
jgi:O-antigen/teichoic acid export membrane protein